MEPLRNPVTLISRRERLRASGQGYPPLGTRNGQTGTIEGRILHPVWVTAVTHETGNPTLRALLGCARAQWGSAPMFSFSEWGRPEPAITRHPEIHRGSGTLLVWRFPTARHLGYDGTYQFVADLTLPQAASRGRFCGSQRQR